MEYQRDVLIRRGKDTYSAAKPEEYRQITAINNMMNGCGDNSAYHNGNYSEVITAGRNYFRFIIKRQELK